MKALLISALFASTAADAAPIRVTDVVGVAEVLRKADGHLGELGPKDDAPWKKIAKGAELSAGDAVRTGDASRVELSLPDGSRIRLGAKSKVSLDEGTFGKARRVGVTMWVGRLWAKVAKELGGDGRFEVETANAVAGVRGTSFTVVAQQDLSALVRVYSGTVGVRKSEGTRPGFRDRARTQVSGPSRVDQRQWEEIVATQMKQITISQVGNIMPAEDFEDEGDELEWAMWNQKRDEAVQ
jgi:hypothetical protein